MPAAKINDSSDSGDGGGGAGGGKWNFTRHLLALFRVPPPPPPAQGTTMGGAGDCEDVLYPSNMRAFVRAMLPALRLCAGVDVADISVGNGSGGNGNGDGDGDGDARRPQTFFFAVLIGWSQAAQAALLPAPDDAIVDDAGRVLLTWLVSCDSAASFGRLAANDFADGTAALCAAVPHGIVPAAAPRIDYVYGTLPAALLPVLKDLYVPSADATDVNGVDSMYVHLSDATAATAATTGNATFLEVVGRGRSVSNAAARGRGFVGALLPPSATRRALSAGDAGVP